jgi:hypothetical protein
MLTITKLFQFLPGILPRGFEAKLRSIFKRGLRRFDALAKR